MAIARSSVSTKKPLRRIEAQCLRFTMRCVYIVVLCLLAFSIHAGSGLRCWSCSSNVDRHCGDPFNRTFFYMQDCDNSRSPHTYNQPSTPVCRKQKQLVNGQELVIRSCVYDKDTAYRRTFLLTFLPSCYNPPSPSRHNTVYSSMYDGTCTLRGSMRTSSLHVPALSCDKGKVFRHASNYSARKQKNEGQLPLQPAENNARSLLVESHLSLSSSIPN